MRRRTLVQAVEKRGTGAAHGQPCAVRLQPAAWGNGLALVFPNERVALKPSNLEGSRELVWFGDESELWGSEPMLAACVVLGITDLDIVVEGEDCPVLDGTMGPWLRALEAAGVQEGPTTEPWAPEEPCFASTEEGFAAIEACDSPEVAVRHHTPLGRVDEGLVPLEPGPVGALLGDSRRVVMDLEACRARGEWLGLSGKFAASSEQELRTPDEAARFMVVMAVAALSALGPCRVRVLLEGASVQALVAALGAVSNRHT